MYVRGVPSNRHPYRDRQHARIFEPSSAPGTRASLPRKIAGDLLIALFRFAEPSLLQFPVDESPPKLAGPVATNRLLFG